MPASDQSDDPDAVAADWNDATALADAEAAKEDSKMTSSEKAQAKADMYGHVHPNETPELVSSSLEALELELQKIPAELRVGHDIAAERCPELLSTKFKIMFLRCEVFNTDVSPPLMAWIF